MGPILNLVEWQFRSGKMSASLTPSFIATPRTGIKLGFIAETRLQLMRILCRVTVLTGLETLIHLLRG